jgi:hypothetical protein
MENPRLETSSPKQVSTENLSRSGTLMPHSGQPTLTEAAWEELWKTVLEAQTAPTLNSALAKQKDAEQWNGQNGVGHKKPSVIPKLPPILFEDDFPAVPLANVLGQPMVDGGTALLGVNQLQYQLQDQLQNGDPQSEVSSGSMEEESRGGGEENGSRLANPTVIGPFIQGIQRDPNTLFVQWEIPERRCFKAETQRLDSPPDQAEGTYVGLNDEEDWRFRVHYRPDSPVAHTEYRAPKETRHYFLETAQATATCKLELGYIDVEGDWVSVASAPMVGGGAIGSMHSAPTEVRVHEPPRQTEPDGMEGLTEFPSTSSGPLSDQSHMNSETARSEPGLERSMAWIEQVGWVQKPHRFNERNPERSVWQSPGRFDGAVETRTYPNASQTARLYALSWEGPEILFQANSGAWAVRDAGDEVVGEGVEQPQGMEWTQPGSVPWVSNPMLPTPASQDLVVDVPLGMDQGVDRDFWFRLQAEVILYGSTKPDAKLTIAGEPVALRADGSFSFRFLLPDGNFRLPVIATSGVGDDSRHATVTFVRTTHREGPVGVHPADPNRVAPEPFDSVRSEDADWTNLG